VQSNLGSGATITDDMIGWFLAENCPTYQLLTDSVAQSIVPLRGPQSGTSQSGPRQVVIQMHRESIRR